MANPNISAATSILGKTEVIYPGTTFETELLSNAASSGKVLKINYLLATNQDTSSHTYSVFFHSEAALGGSSYSIVEDAIVSGSRSSNTITLWSPEIYLTEDSSIGVTVSSGNTIAFIVSYEEVS